MAKPRYSKAIALSKEPFRLWYEFLKRAKAKGMKVHKDYAEWGDTSVSFKKWWEQHGSGLISVVANGVELERLPESELSKFEPLARTVGSFLWSPNTTVSNPVLINEALRNELISKDVKFISNSRVYFKEERWMNYDDVI